MSLSEKMEQFIKSRIEPYSQNSQNSQNGTFANNANNANRGQISKVSSQQAYISLMKRLDELPETSLEILTYHPMPTFTLTGEYDGAAYRLFLMAVDEINEHALGVARMRQ